MSEIVERLRKEGYPRRIKGNGGYEACLVGVQPLIGGHAAIYRYPGGDCVHSLWEIRSARGFEVLEE